MICSPSLPPWSSPIPLIAANLWIDDNFSATRPPYNSNRLRPIYQNRSTDILEATTVLTEPAAAILLPGWLSHWNSRRASGDPRRLSVHHRQAALIDEAMLYQWPDTIDFKVFGPGVVLTGSVTVSNWLLSRSTGPQRRTQRNASETAPADIFLGDGEFSLATSGDFGNGSQWVSASASLRLARYSGARQWSWSYPDRTPDLPQEMLVTLTRMGAHALPVARRVGPTMAPAYLDPLEFRTIIAFDAGGTTQAPRGPGLRRSFGDDLAFGVFVASPEITAHISGDATTPSQRPPRTVRGTMQALPLDSDFLGPLPATFTFSPAPPTQIPRGPARASDGSLRDLPDTTEAILGVWQSHPQAPTKPLTRVPPGADSARGVWFDSLVIDVLMPWAGTPQTPVRQVERRTPEAAAYYTWSPLGDPMAWDVGPQARRLPRPGPTAHEYVSAPPIYSSGISLVIAGPYYAVAQQIYTAGAVAGQSVSE